LRKRIGRIIKGKGTKNPLGGICGGENNYPADGVKREGEGKAGI